MAVTKRNINKSNSKSKRKPSKGIPIDISAVLERQLGSLTIGKALSAIDILYAELDDMQMRLDILISRIAILKKRTKALRQGELITLSTKISAIGGTGNKPNDLTALRKTGGGTSNNNADEAKVEWTKLKLLSETTINDVLLATDTIVSIESQAAAGLIEQGVAEAIEIAANKGQNTEQETKDAKKGTK